jgi:GNAT superfamily N-acetyltransferase
MAAETTSGAGDAPAPRQAPAAEPPLGVRVRHAEARDAGQLAHLVAALNRGEGNPCLDTVQTLQRDLIGSAFVVLAEAPDGILVGYATGHQTYETGHAEAGLYVGDLYVAPSHRRRGVARAMLAALARAGHATGARHLWLTALEGNAPAHAFYRRLGAKGERIMAFAVVHQDFLNLAAEPPP